jgi:hypothetical protein
MKSASELPEVEKVSPEKLLAGFARGRIALWMIVAVVAHVLLIGGTSIGTIRDRWVDPEGAQVRKAKAQEIVAAAKKAAANAAAAAAPKAKLPAAAGASATNAAPVAAASTNEPVAGRAIQDTPVMQRITATATTNELPKPGDDLGISIRDTNVK